MAQPEIHYIKIIPEPPEPTVMDHVYDLLDEGALLMLKGSFFLLALAVFSDIIG